jgi:NAD-dependent DNA ligase
LIHIPCRAVFCKEPENIEIDGEIFVNNADFDHLMQAEGTNLPLIELQDQNVNPTVDELTVTGN